MKEPKMISIGIPSYNRPEYLRILIQSILLQTYTNFEIIIYDDGSPRVTEIELMVKEFNDKRIRLLLGENVWFIKNWNRILLLCQWEYIKILWDDDILIETCLELQSEVLENNADVWLVCCSYDSINENGVVLDTKDFNPSSFRLFQEDTKEDGKDLVKNFLLWKRRIWLPTAMMFRKEAIEKIGFFNEEAGSPADVDYWIRICSEYNFYYLDKNLIKLRWHSNNLSRSLEKDITSFEKIVYVIFGNGFPLIQSQLSIGDRLRILTRYFYTGFRYMNLKNIYRISKIYVYILRKLVFNY